MPIPTEIIKIVDPDNGPGTDYTSLHDWVLGERRHLVACNEIATALCRSSAGSPDIVHGGVSIEADPMAGHWITDENCYIKILTEEGSRHSGIWDDTKYRLVNDTGSYVLKIEQVPYTQVYGLQIHETFNYSAISLYGLGLDISGVKISKCIIKGVGVAQRSSSGIYVFNATAYHEPLKIWDNIIYDFELGITTFGVDAYSCNNTVCRCGQGYHISAMPDHHKCMNNIANLCDVGFYGTSGGDHIDYNISNQNDATGPHSRNNCDVTFEDPDNDDFHLNIFDLGARTAGIDLSADPCLPFDDDIDGEERIGHWDIGADQYSQDESPPGCPYLTSRWLRPNWAKGLSLGRTWRTSIQRSIIGQEKRSALYTRCQRELKYSTLFSSSADFNHVKRKLFGNIQNVWGIPLWLDGTQLTMTAMAGTDFLQLHDIMYRDFQVGWFVVLVGVTEDYEAGEIIEIIGNQITLKDSLVNTWLAGAEIYPLIRSRISANQKMQVLTDGKAKMIIDAKETLE